MTPPATPVATSAARTVTPATSILRKRMSWDLTMSPRVVPRAPPACHVERAVRQTGGQYLIHEHSIVTVPWDDAGPHRSGRYSGHIGKQWPGPPTVEEHVIGDGATQA